MLFLGISWYLILTLILAVYIYSCIKPSNFPPGPSWLPILGCILAFRKVLKKEGYTYLAFEQLCQIYGPIIGLKLGNQQLVVISTHDLVKKGLCMKELDGRPDGFFFRMRSYGKRKGVLFTDGEKWYQHRQFTLKHLRNFGFGRSLMREKLVEEARKVVLYIQNQIANDPKVAIQMVTFFDLPVLNVLWMMFAGHRFDYDDKKVLKIMDTVHEAFKIMDCMGGLMSHLPILRFICPKFCGYTDMMRIQNNLALFMEEEIIEHEKDLPQELPRDLIDAFLMEMQNKDNKNSIFEREELIILCLDLFMAGSETTSNTLSNIFLFLGLNPDWLKKLQGDLEIVIGRNRLPEIDDISQLPTIEAFIAECQRYIPLAPLGVPHRATKDVWINGYRIPKGTTTLFNYYSVANDSAYWDNPKEFRPERFISNGRFKQNNNNIPFGLGKRRCLGEVLARGSLFIFLTTIIHYYDFEICRENGGPSTNGFDGFVITPKPFKLIFHLRSDISCNNFE